MDSATSLKGQVNVSLNPSFTDETEGAHKLRVGNYQRLAPVTY